MHQTPLTLRDASTGLWVVGANDAPGAQVWVGRSPEKLVLGGSYQERVLYYPGRDHGQCYHEDEEHTIELENVWLQDVSSGPARMPVLERGRRHQFVCVWEDRAAAVWTRRVYTGVTVQPNQVDDFRQTLRLRAEQMFESTGTGPASAPSATAAPAASVAGRVTYVNGFERTDLYRYDFTTETYEVIEAGLLAGRAEIDLSVAGACTIAFAGTPALYATAALCEVREISAEGGTFLDESPRLEWYRGTARSAALSATGVLAVTNVAEQPAAPPVADDFATAPGAWLFSLAKAGAYAPAFAETL